MTRVLIFVMRLLARLPLSWVRGLGAGLGWLLWRLAHARRHVVQRNLALCFPDLSPAERHALAYRHFICLGQSLLDRAWLWHAPWAVVEARLHWVSALDVLASHEPLIAFAPHFVGLDAGGMAISHQSSTPVAFIYVGQSEPALEAWVRKGRERSGNVRPFFRHEGVRQIISSLRKGEKLHLSPDMDLGRAESVFVPFMGVSAATVPSLSRMARLGGARVVPMVTRLTAQGYSIELGAALENFPTSDAVQDTVRMNQLLEQAILTMPEQYYWVHKRFKTRPEGEPGVY
jgi:Kdo2-lipid IVA lauroyltransferase/acyltransferase